MELTYKDINFLMSWLNLPLHSKMSRARNKFVFLIEPTYELMREKRIEMLDLYADKNEEGKAIIEEGVYKMTDDNKQKFLDEYGKYLDENKVLLDTSLSEFRQLCRVVKEILIEKLDKQFNIEEGKNFDSIVDKFEKVG